MVEPVTQTKTSINKEQPAHSQNLDPKLGEKLVAVWILTLAVMAAACYWRAPIADALFGKIPCGVVKRTINFGKIPLCGFPGTIRKGQNCFSTPFITRSCGQRPGFFATWFR